MKKNCILGFIFLMVLSALMVIACDLNSEEKNPFKGTWKSSEGYTAYFEDTSWHIPLYSRGKGLKGTYTYGDNTATVTYTEISDDETTWRPITSSEASSYVSTATVSGNKLTWGITTYTKQ